MQQYIDKNNHLWQVDPILTDDNDPQLNALTGIMRKETSSGQFNKAEELYEILFVQTANVGEKLHLFHQLGCIKDNQGKYLETIEFYEKALEISQKTLPADHPDFDPTYGYIGMMSSKIGEHSKVVLYCEQTLKVAERSLTLNHPDTQLHKGNLESVKSCK